ncbi:prominin-1-A-like isoform X2 [Acanthaster planci]|uniref:Prominin-1-A-like isoform X2 n=1 Tax=Acanthaster planci TaxID=133434 RepID=A0A8B7XKK7_ACAPL|nr:prominin-1-A-like isoform X2 [Acanthaster planci]
MELTRLWRHIYFLLLVGVVGLTLLGVASGNLKNSNDDITWDSLPPDPKYNTSTAEPHLTFDLVFVVASEFIQAIAPHEFPWDFLRGIINGTVNPLRDYKDIVSYSVGFIACFAVALLFVVVMPITGLLFCCCRLCENCGGKMLQRDKYNTSCRRLSFGFALLIITALMTLGLAGVIMANSQMSTSVNDIKPTIDSNLDDVGAYLKHTFQEFYFLAVQQFGYVSGLIFTDLLHVDRLVGKPIRDDFARQVEPALRSVNSLGKETIGLQGNLRAVNESVAMLLEKGASLQEMLDTARGDINATLQSIPCNPGQTCPKDVVNLSEITVAADFSIIDVQAELNLVNDALNANITELVDKGQEELDGIPDRVKNESQDAVDYFKLVLDKLAESILEEIQNIDFKISPEVEKFLAAFSKDATTPQAKQLYSSIELVHTIDKYRFYVGIALSCIIFIVILCNVLGMLFGECGRDKKDRPTERPCLSNFGGTLLLAGVAFSFIFSALIMILTTLCFLLGGISEKVICEPVTSRAIFKEVVDYPYLIDRDSRYWLSDNLFGKGSDPLTVESVIISCEMDYGLYTALKLGNIFNITAALDYRKMYPDIETKLGDINVDLSQVQILDPEMKMALTKFVDSGVANLNYTQYLQEIRKGVTQANLTGIAADLERFAQLSLPYSNQSKLRLHANTLRMYQTDLVDPMESYVDTLEASLDVLMAKVGNLSPSVNKSLIDVQETQDYIHNHGPTLFNEALKQFVNKILNYVDQYVLYVLGEVNNEVGGCKPVANLYDSLEILVCKNLVYAFNGFWLCLGWCVILFIPSIIFAVKLSKFYRRMRFYEDYYNAHDMETVPMKIYE